MSWIADIMEYNEEVEKARERMRKRMKKPLFEVQSKTTGNFYNVYEKKIKRNGYKYYKIYNWVSDSFEWWFEDRFEERFDKIEGSE